MITRYEKLIEDIKAQLPPFMTLDGQQVAFDPAGVFLTLHLIELHPDKVIVAKKPEEGTLDAACWHQRLGKDVQYYRVQLTPYLHGTVEMMTYSEQFSSNHYSVTLRCSVTTKLASKSLTQEYLLILLFKHPNESPLSFQYSTEEHPSLIFQRPPKWV